MRLVSAVEQRRPRVEIGTRPPLAEALVPRMRPLDATVPGGYLTSRF
ncbi:hypothetical protein JXM67_11830 [candidate division WOR-3 bacterium]|nr:hypothetical protein [candidate division WOR-3 bacterium]